MLWPHRFRSWLVGRVASTEGGKLGRTAAGAEKHAVSLGLQPSVLMDAYRRRAALLRSRSLRPPLGAKVNERDHPQVELKFPPVIFEAWHTWCEQRSMQSSAALRSLVHHYLLGASEPEWLTSAWSYRGRLYPPSPKPRVREKALVTQGAMQALRRRAAADGVTVTTLLRGLVLEALAGRVVDLRIVDARTMWDDPDKYWMPAPPRKR